MYVYICPRQVTILYACIHVYMCTCMYIFTYIYIYIYMYIHLCIYIHIYIYKYIYMCVYLTTTLCVHVYMYTCIHVYMYTYTYIYGPTLSITQIRKGQHCRSAFSELILNWYKPFCARPFWLGRVEMKQPTGMSNKSSTA